MAKNFNGTQINNSATIVEKAGAEIADCRNKIMKYDGNGRYTGIFQTSEDEEDGISRRATMTSLELSPGR